MGCDYEKSGAVCWFPEPGPAESKSVNFGVESQRYLCMHHQIVVAVPVDGHSSETLADQFADADRWGEHTSIYRGVVQVEGWGEGEADLGKSCSSLETVDGIDRACWLTVKDVDYGSVAYFDHVDGKLRKIDTHSGISAEEMINYVNREYGLVVPRSSILVSYP